MNSILSISASFAFLVTAQAAVIAWGGAANTTDPTNISTNGTLPIAHNGGGSSVTVNTVTFAAADLLAGQTTGNGLLNGGTTGDANFNTLLDEVDFGGGAGGGPPPSKPGCVRVRPFAQIEESLISLQPRQDFRALNFRP